MELRRKAASLLTVGFDGLAPGREVRELIAAGISGAILFKRNVDTARQVAELCAELKREAGRPFLLCVDQEGGRVARLRGEPFTALPPMRVLGAANDPALAFDAGRLLAREVRAAGFDVDFAPVLDVDTNPANPVIGDRSLAAEAQTVARLAHGMERLRSVELVPFAAYARARLASIMTAHVVFEAIAPGIPATFSREVQTGLLREELGFEGLIITDDLEMKAIADHHSMEEAAVSSVAAGCDLLLVCHHAERQHACIEGLVREAERSVAFRARLEDAAARVARFAERFAAAPANPDAALARLAGEEHRALRARVIAAGEEAAAIQGDPTEVMQRPA